MGNSTALVFIHILYRILNRIKRIAEMQLNINAKNGKTDPRSLGDPLQSKE